MVHYDEAIASFWNWLVGQKRALDKLKHPDDPFWDTVLDRLHAVDRGLWFEVSNGPFTPRDFVVTAGRNIALFPLVDVLAAAAPDLPGWRIIALKQPEADDPLVMTEYEGHILQPANMWFLPLQSKSDPTLLALRVAIPGFQEESLESITTGILVMLDSILGERDAALEIQGIVPCQVPPDPPAAGFIQLARISEFIAWRKRQK